MRKLFLDNDDPASGLTALPAAVEVTLRSVDQLDEFDERRIVVGPNASISVGRSSKNTSKRLMAGPNNLYFDSPVISREHAIVSANAALGIPTVYLTDKGSMHGTKVNGSFIERNREHRLHNGDTLQFGVDVVRDQGKDREFHSTPHICPLQGCVLTAHSTETFIAKQYKFSSRVASADPNPLFPRGVSVPDDVSSDEEDDIEDEASMRSSPNPHNYGSQTNPVNVDDFGDSQDVIHLQDEEDPFSPLASIQPSNGVIVEQKMEIHTTAITDSQEAARNSPPRSMASPLSLANEDDSSEVDNHEDDIRSIGTSEMELESQDDDDSLSGDESADSSDAESNCASDVAEVGQGEKENAEAVRRLKLLDYERQRATAAGNGFIQSQVAPPTAPTVQTFQSPPAVQGAPALPEPYKFACSSASTHLPAGAPPKENESMRFKNNGITPMSLFSDDYMGNPWSGDSMMSSRPPAPKQMQWNNPRVTYSSSPNFMRDGNSFTSWPEDPQPVNMFGMAPMQDYRTETLPSFSRAPPPPPPPPREVAHQARPIYSSFMPSELLDNSPVNPENIHNAHDDHDGVDTAALIGVPTPPMPCSEDMSSTTPQQTPRTKVSIAEIVEEAPQQPPTPTSVSSLGNLKRKADVLDEEENETREESPFLPAVEQVIVPVTEVGPAVAPRPKKRLRAALAYGGTAAASVVFTTVAVVGALMALPDGYFE